jgi:hypothetical protein
VPSDEPDRPLTSTNPVKTSALRSTLVERVAERLGGLRLLLDHDQDGSLSLERFLLLLIRTSRNGKSPPHSERELIRFASRRRRYLGTRCTAAGPFMGVATKLIDLYCETALVCEVAELHQLDLGDQEIAAHMLLLWGVTDDRGQARAAVDPARPGTIAGLVIGRARDELASESTQGIDALSAAKALWSMRGSVAQVARPTGAQSIRGWLLARRRAKRFVKHAQRQLGLRDDGAQVNRAA